MLSEHSELSLHKAPNGYAHSGEYGLRFTVNKTIVIHSALVVPYFTNQNVTVKLYDFTTKELVQETEPFSVVSGSVQRVKLGLVCHPGVSYWMSPTLVYGSWMRTGSGISFPYSDDVFNFTVGSNLAGATADRWYYFFDMFYTPAFSIENHLRANVSEVGITNGLVAYYPLNKDAKDLSGNGYHGTVNGATLVGGGFDGNGAYRFNEYPNSLAGMGQWTSLPKFTYAAWVNREVNQDNFLVVGARQGNNTYISLAVIGDKVCLHKYGFNNNSDINVAPSAATIGTGSWKHIAVTYDAGETRTYVDGILEGQGFHLNTSSAAYPFQINYESGVSLSYRAFRGDICNVKIFNRALTPEEIAVEYKRTGPTKMTQSNGTVYLQGQVKETT